MDVIQQIKGLIDSIDTDDATEAEKLVKQLTGLADYTEDKLSELGVKHKLYIDIGEYGSGRTLIVEEGHWSGYEVGSWLPSSETC